MKKIEIGILNDYYGKLLNSHQAEIMRMYYDCDMSLGEIADQLDITRQGVREVIIRSEKKLYEYESKLNLVKNIKTISNDMKEVIASVEKSTTKKSLEKILNSIKEL